MRKEVKGFSDKDVLLAEYTLINDKKNGMAKAYYQTGELLSKTPYLDGEYHGACTSYHKSGELWYEVFYLNGKEVTKKGYNDSLNSCEGKVVEIEGKKYELREIE